MKTSLLYRTAFSYLLLAALFTSARAQSTVPSCADNPSCKSLFEQGKAQSSAGNLDEALRLYQRAHDITADPDLLFSIARVQHKQGNTAAAVSNYQQFLGSPADAPEQRKKAQEYLKELQASGVIGLRATGAGKPVNDSKPVYKKWWFWTILGTVAAAGIAGGIAGGVTASQPPKFDSSLPNFTFKPTSLRLSW